MIPVKIMTQPDDFTCGPTSLHAVYNYYKDRISLETVIKEIAYLKKGGTLAVLLGCHALSRGYKAKIYTYNLKVFDLTWTAYKSRDMVKKLRKQLRYKRGKNLQAATRAYIKFLELGGELVFENLTPALLDEYFDRKIPILAGLSATYLYRCAREFIRYDNVSVYDDIKGMPAGHFVVLCGREKKKQVIVADPYKANPVSGNNYYSVDVYRLINAIHLGVVTYDANLLVIKRGRRLHA